MLAHEGSVPRGADAREPHTVDATQRGGRGGQRRFVAALDQAQRARLGVDGIVHVVRVGRARRRARGHGARPSVHAGAAWRDATTRRRARGPDQTPVASSDRSGRSGALAQRTPAPVLVPALPAAPERGLIDHVAVERPHVLAVIAPLGRLEAAAIDVLLGSNRQRSAARPPAKRRDAPASVGAVSRSCQFTACTGSAVHASQKMSFPCRCSSVRADTPRTRSSTRRAYGRSHVVLTASLTASAFAAWVAKKRPSAPAASAAAA